jgi:hypothetical protein
MMGKRALATLLIGEHYQQLFRARCEPSWRQYCANHAHDLIVIDRPLDVSPRALARSPAWQKLLILELPELQHYEQVAWVDADIVINAARSPSIFDGVPVERIGAVDEFASPSPAEAVVALRRHHAFLRAAKAPVVPYQTAEAFYEQFGLPRGFPNIVQTGVLVISPHHHRALLRHVYDRYEDRGTPQWNYEMRPLGFEIQSRGLAHWLDPRFNAIWPTYCMLHYPFMMMLRDAPPILKKLVVSTALANNYFLHFAGSRGALDHYDPAITVEFT